MLGMSQSILRNYREGINSLSIWYASMHQPLCDIPYVLTHLRLFLSLIFFTFILRKHTSELGGVPHHILTSIEDSVGDVPIPPPPVEEEEKAVKAIDASMKDPNAEIIIPADFFFDLTPDEVVAFAKEDGINEVIANADGMALLSVPFSSILYQLFNEVAYDDIEFDMFLVNHITGEIFDESGLESDFDSDEW